ncbi:n-acetylmuramoyl-l-alanine amidase [hydrocarbon metagenome]|uniref:N-acetylmuramoyl-l-alanine amidase n=1 Tax=hydrocarbon metagenome TaxID=938273 RepID=A0A0W8E9E7_9ZZZZ
MMKRLKLVALVAILIMAMVIPVSAAAPNVTVKIDGAAVAFPDQKPYIDSNDRTLVPMRAPMEALGATVDWDNATRQAIFEKDGTTVVFTIGSRTYTINGVNKTMDTQAVITGDRTCIPIRYAAEAIGATVGWDGATRTVLISTKAGVVGNTLSAEKIAELKAIPYDKTPDAEMGDPKVTTSLNCSDTYQGLLDHMVLKPNQKFITSRELLYMSSGSPGGTGEFCLRGVLQETNADGSINEYNAIASAFYGGSSKYDGIVWHNVSVIEIGTWKVLN